MVILAYFTLSYFQLLKVIFGYFMLFIVSYFTLGYLQLL